MAMQWDRHAFSGSNLLGVAPRRQLCAARAAGDAHVMMRVERFLCALRRAGRRSVFIVDNKCGDGRLLIRAAARASALGARDPAIGFSFLVRADGAPLPVEDDEADLMLAARGEDEAAEIARVADPDGAIVSHR